MKKIYLIGDMINDNGPAMVNKSYYPYLKNKVIFCFTNNKVLRTLHFLICILFINTVVISGFSKLNILLLKIAKILNKKTFYLMHGFVLEEIKYQNISNKEEKIKLEYQLLNMVDYIICVSENFSEYLKSKYTEFKDKILFVNNGIDANINIKKIPHDKFTIISVGGGMKIKNNLSVCKAIEKGKIDGKFIVIGNLAEDGEKIKQYDFVEYYESLTHDEVLNKMCESDLYIQNSYFETFGLAIIEALECKCDILISKNVGALSVLQNIRDDDLIMDVENIDEISNKIKNNLLKNKCNIFYNKNKCSFEKQSKVLLKILNNKG